MTIGPMRRELVRLTPYSTVDGMDNSLDDQGHSAHEPLSCSVIPITSGWYSFTTCLDLHIRPTCFLFFVHHQQLYMNFEAHLQSSTAQYKYLFDHLYSK